MHIHNTQLLFLSLQYFTNWIEKSFRNDETIISSISVTDIFFDVYYFGSAEGHEYPVL